MGNQITPFDAAGLPAELADLFDVEGLQEDLSAGVEGGFSVVSIRGSKWRIKHAGDEEPVVDDKGEPIPSLEVVILKANKNVSKIYYQSAYSEGDSSEPDCFSIDGIKPEQGCSSPQSLGCASCPHNQWGSRVTEQGKKAKACSDNRRVAVVPANDIMNEVYGGAMLLRIPAASLSDMATYGTRMASKGFPYNAVVTRIGFDLDTAYPKLTFKAVRPLDNDELLKVATHLQGEVVTRIMSSSEDIKPVADPETPAAAPTPETPAPVATVNDEFDSEGDMFDAQTPAPTTAVPDKEEVLTPAQKAAKTRAANKAKKEAEKAAENTPAAQPPATDGIDQELDDILGDLENLS